MRKGDRQNQYVDAVIYCKKREFLEDKEEITLTCTGAIVYNGGLETKYVDYCFASSPWK